MNDIDDLRAGLRDIAAEGEPVDLGERVLASSRRLGIYRMVGFAAVALSIAAITATGIVELNRAGPPPVTSVSVAPHPVVPSSVTLPNYMQAPSPDLGPFKNATIVVPSWGAAAGSCATGSVRLHNGQYYPDPGLPAVNVMSYLRVDVDGDGVGDYVARLACGEGPESPGQQIVAFRPSNGRLVPIGRVVGSQDGFAMMDAMQVRGGGRLAVQVSAEYSDGGQQYVPSQWRVYAWQSGRFRQVGGPTSFLARAPYGALSVNPADLVFEPAGAGRYVGDMTVTVNNSGTADVAHSELVLILPAQVTAAGDGWTGCTVGASALHCPLPALAAHTTRQLHLQFLATDPKPAGADPIGPSNHDHYLRIDQLPPYTFIDSSVDPEAPIRIVVH